jgi:hypothetical protein
MIETGVVANIRVSLKHKPVTAPFFSVQDFVESCVIRSLAPVISYIEVL